MDQYDSHSHSPWSRERQHEGSTPIYDRLLAEWRGADRSPERDVPVASAGVAKSVFVPSARRAGRPGVG